MIRSRVDLPAPLSPRTPILAPWKKLSEMSASTCLSGGWVRETRCMVKMYSEDTVRQVRESALGLGHAGPDCLGEVRVERLLAAGDRHPDHVLLRRRDHHVRFDRVAECRPGACGFLERVDVDQCRHVELLNRVEAERVDRR